MPVSQAEIAAILSQAAALHQQACPRMALGVRMGLHAGELLGLPFSEDKRLLAIVETDGCFLDGVAAAVRCTPGRRTLRVEDYGKVAATFVDVLSSRSIRLVPAPGCRLRALEYAPEAADQWEGQLLGYQRMPAEELFTVTEVELAVPGLALLGDPAQKAVCSSCGEEIINGREISAGGQAYCRGCAGLAYYLRREAP
jgi:formylmethanofuran dehydrogenase subunit E